MFCDIILIIIFINGYWIIFYSKIFFFLDCENGYFGIECLEKCICEVENIDICDKVFGNCSCRVGWKGMNCFEDIDECLVDVNNLVCLDYLNCINLNGIYLCICDEGFFMLNNWCIGKCVCLFF